MTKNKELPEEATPMAEPTKLAQSPPITDWERMVRLWADKTNIFPVAQRLRDELARAGITSVEMVARAPVVAVAAAARAALVADAQALQAAARQIMEDKE